jgi:aspartate/methionine/tyrosine aminotransferase
MKIADFKLERFFSQHEFKMPWLLCSSDCESFTLGELLAMEEGALEVLENLWLGYTETQGNPLLRAEVAKLYTTVTADEIIIFSGAEEAIFITMNVLLEKDDHLVVEFPAYQSLFEIARYTGAEVTLWLMREDAGWQPDMECLRTALNIRTKAIVINNPHNPTGFLMTREDLHDLVALARKSGSVIFSDEVYRLTEYDPARRLPAICDCYEKCLSLGVMSKAFGLAGLRIGWLVCKDRQLRDRILAFKDYTTICSSAPSALLSTLALRQSDSILERNLAIINGNMTLLRKFFDRHREIFRWVEPLAGPIAFPAFLPGGSCEKFCSDLAREKGVLLLPGTLYDHDDRHFRLGYGRKNMPQALEKLEEYIEAARYL